MRHEPAPERRARPPTALRALLRAIHGQLHEAMVAGQIPTAVELGWLQYGRLYRGEAALPDGERPRTVFDLPIVPVARPDHVGLRVTDRRGW